MPDIDAKKIEAGSLWRHKKRGSVYRVIDGSAQVQAPEDSGLTDYEVVVVYQSNAGETWVRRHSEFLDGRFEKLSEPPSKKWLTRMAAAEDGHEVGAGATLSLAGEDAEGLCEQLKVVSYGADEDDAKILQAARDTIRSLSLRVEAEKRAREEAERERDESRIFVINHTGGVCIGGRFHGWLMRKHPDGLWVSVRKLDQEEPRNASPLSPGPAKGRDEKL